MGALTKSASFCTAREKLGSSHAFSLIVRCFKERWKGGNRFDRWTALWTPRGFGPKLHMLLNQHLAPNRCIVVLKHILTAWSRNTIIDRHTKDSHGLKTLQTESKAQVMESDHRQVFTPVYLEEKCTNQMPKITNDVLEMYKNQLKNSNAKKHSFKTLIVLL